MPRLASLSSDRKVRLSGQLRSIFIRRIVGSVTILKDGKPFRTYHEGSVMTNISLAFADSLGDYPMGDFTVKGVIEGSFEFGSNGDRSPYSPSLHFPAFVRGD